MIRRKEDKLQGDITLVPGIEIDRSFYNQNESRIWMLMLKGVLVYLLVMGSMGSYLSAFDIECSTVTMHLVVVLSSIFCSFVYYNKIFENIGYLFLAFILIYFAYHWGSYINSGFFAVVNDTIDEASRYFDIDSMRNYGEQFQNRYQAITIAMSFIGSVCSVLLSIMISRKIRFFAIVPSAFFLLLIPLYMGREPAWLYTVMLFAGIIAAYVIKGGRHYGLVMTDAKFRVHKKEINYIYDIRTLGTAAGIVTGFVIIIAVSAGILYPRNQYVGGYKNSELKERTMDMTGNFLVLGYTGIFNFYTGIGGGLSQGTLGGVSSVTFDFETDLTIKFTPYQYDRIYLKSFAGSIYAPFLNQWNNPSSTMLGGLRKEEGKEVRALAGYYQEMGEYSAMGKMEITNVATVAAYYIPYYAKGAPQYIYPGDSVEYSYYPWLKETEASVRQRDVLHPLSVNSPQGNTWETKAENQEDLEEYLMIPPENKEVVEQFCEEAGLGGTQEEIISRLCQYYQDNIPYTLRPGATPRNQDFINFFLENNRKGYCAHFASAATLIFRHMGIPARYVEGYALDYSNVLDYGELIAEEYKNYYKGYSPIGETGVVLVALSDANAHAWVEIYDEVRGWQVVEVTPYSLGEESGQDFWSNFFNLFGGDEATEVNEGGDDNNPAFFNINERVGYLVRNAMIIIFTSFICIIAGWFLFRKIRWQIRYQKSGNNDKIIMIYEKIVQKYRRKYHDFTKEINYRNQIEWMRKNKIIALSEMERERMEVLLEQAGFSNINISENDFKWLLTLLKNNKRKGNS